MWVTLQRGGEDEGQSVYHRKKRVPEDLTKKFGRTERGFGQKREIIEQ